MNTEAMDLESEMGGPQVARQRAPQGVKQYTVTVEGKDYDVDAPDETTAWQWANQYHRQAQEKTQAATQGYEQEARDQASADEAARPWTDRAWENLGAGMTKAKEGIQQLAGLRTYTGDKQRFVSDEQVQQTRQAADELAAGTSGGRLLQIAGETLPTLAVPGGGLRGVGGVALDAAVGGGLAGAIQPTMEGESKLANTALGAAGGAAGGAALGGAARYLPLARKAGRAARAEENAGELLARQLGTDTAEAARLLRQPGQRFMPNLPRTAAQEARLSEGRRAGPVSTKLAALELAARRELPPDFAELGNRQNRALYEAATAGTPGEADITKLATARDAATGPLREQALGSANRWPAMARPLGRAVEKLRAGTAKGTPGRKLADLMDNALGENPSAQQLYDFRKMLAAKLDGPTVIGDETSAIVKGAKRKTMDLIKAIDDRLNEAASSKKLGDSPWSDYLQTYSRESVPVTSARAQRDITEALMPAGGPEVGGSPEITRTKLQRALQKHSKGSFGSRLDRGSQQRYARLQRTMQRLEEPIRNVKLGGTGGGGSQTAMQTALGERAGEKLLPLALAKIPLAGKAFAALSHIGEQDAKQELARMMLDPDRASRALEAKLRAGQPLTAGEELFHKLLAGGGVATGAAIPAPGGQQ